MSRVSWLLRKRHFGLRDDALYGGNVTSRFSWETIPTSVYIVRPRSGDVQYRYAARVHVQHVCLLEREHEDSRWISRRSRVRVRFGICVILGFPERHW
jgi:hypothetical protein